MFWVEAAQLDPPDRATHKLLSKHLPGERARDDTIATAYRSVWGNNDHIAVSIDRFHRVPADLQSVGIRITNLRGIYFVPSSADRVATIVEESRRTGLRQSNQRYRASRLELA